LFKVKKILGEPIVGIFNLMPTFRHLWEGLDFNIKIAILPFVRQAIAYTINFFPQSIINHLLEKGTRSTLSNKIISSLQEKINSSTVLNILHMAYSEGNEVIEIEDDINEVFENHSEKLIVMYAYHDKYTPIYFRDELIKKYPKVHVVMAKEDVIEHSFVINHSNEVAEQVYTIYNSHFK